MHERDSKQLQTLNGCKTLIPATKDFVFIFIFENTWPIIDSAESFVSRLWLESHFRTDVTANAIGWRLSLTVHESFSSGFAPGMTNKTVIRNFNQTTNMHESLIGIWSSWKIATWKKFELMLWKTVKYIGQNMEMRNISPMIRLRLWKIIEWNFNVGKMNLSF